jgi:hypothetical protein
MLMAEDVMPINLQFLQTFVTRNCFSRIILGEILGSDGSEDGCLLDCCTMQSGRQ